jgi:hypothetical protein
LTLREELVAIFHDLMRTADEVHVVLLQEAGDHIRPECEAYTSVVLTPPGDVLVWVGPQEIAEKTAIGDLYVSVSVLKLFRLR